MGLKVLAALILGVTVWQVQVQGQENTLPRIPSSLIECYHNSTLLQRELRLVSSMQVLVDLIRRIEDHPEMVNRDMREVVIQIIHRFKQDGIQKSSRVSASSGVVPYSPSAFPFFKHQIALKELLQGNAATFPNDTLTSIERCSLHHMMSSTIELEVRNDEDRVCSRLSQYRTMRVPREAPLDSDVEVLDANLVNKLNEKGNMQVDPEEQNNEAEIVDDPAVVAGPQPRNMESTVSQCPVEDGIVHSLWGSVAVGPLLMGIAAGLQVTRVSIKELTSKNTTYSGLIVDNRYALTMAGDVGEVTLFQGPVNPNIRVGGSGGWNNTQAPRWFFLSQATNNEMTDAEIRGGLDGLILASEIQRLKQRAPSMRLSQLLEMYYSQRGVFENKFRACYRQPLFDEYTPREIFLNQSLAMSLLLDEVTLLQGTIIDDGYQTLSSKAVEALRRYIPQMRDLQCTVTETKSEFGDVPIRSNITIVLDKAFLYKEIESTIIDIFHKINTSPVGSSVMVVSASEGKVICNTTNSLATIIQNLNQDTYNMVPEKLDMYKVLESLRELNRFALANETARRWSGGMSSVVVFIIGANTAFEEGSYSADMLRYIYEEIPDLRFLFFTNGDKQRFKNLVRDPVKDTYSFTLSNDRSTEPDVKSLVSRIAQVPKRLINHRCGPNYEATETGSDTFADYVAPQMINYYRLHPNYFFRNNGETIVRVTGTSSSSLTLCYSRNVELPRSNSSNGEETTCVALTSGAQEISLRDACSGVDYIFQCSPLFFSVEAGPSAENTSPQICAERACPQPDNLRYTIHVQGLGCYSSSTRLLSSLTLLAMSLLVLLRM